MYPHVKLFHLINSDKDKRLKLLNRHKDDAIFKQLVEIMTSPDYIITYVEEPTFEKCITIDTVETFNTFILLLHKAVANNDITALFKYVNGLDSITKYVYLHVIRGNDLGMPFTTVAKILDLNVRRMYSEIPKPFGFPTFPFFIQYIETGVDYYDIHISPTFINVTYIDGRKALQFDSTLYQEFNKLKLNGVIKGYVKDNIYVVTNYYTYNHFGTFTERLRMVEVDLLRINSYNVRILPLLEVHNVYELEDIVDRGKDMICIPDEEQHLDGEHNIYALQGHRLVALIEERRKEERWNRDIK